MKIFIILWNVCSLVSGCNVKMNDRIIGGQETTIDEYPYQVTVQYMNRHICGGSILNRNTILTAAHCIASVDPLFYTIRVGSSFHQKGQKYTLSKIIKHPNYDHYNSNKNDLAILKLTQSLIFTNNVRPVELQPAGKAIPNGTIGFVSGWGTLKAGSFVVPDKLHVTHLSIISNKKCERLYKNRAEITQEMLCAQAFGRDSCQGDSGGPLVANGKLIGVVSWGFGCAEIGSPGVYVNISSVRDFIDNYL